jgi:hypothetical protein
MFHLLFACGLELDALFGYNINTGVNCIKFRLLENNSPKKQGEKRFEVKTDLIRINSGNPASENVRQWQII